MFHRPYFDHAYFHDDGQRNYPYPQQYNYNLNTDPGNQNYHGSNPYNFQAVQQTPYDYFAKPQQPMSWPGTKSQLNQQTDYQDMNVPEFATQDQAPPGPGQQLDLDKMLSTVGQLANTYHQVSPIVKQFGSLIKTFR
ncbi:MULTISPECIES: YppG family protein [Virgibacillus]|uniref:YppG-like protein n=2 Tax=Virgibacillus TaxID=84406 RepID=A0A024QG38_9BACI|nr:MULTISPECIES: YppG family protein [Virgibacillus]EQB38796.1 hypothetical protein M948_00195 [Virgibacillus sp. CM-4]MYL43850.1 hypothetical protein [Virgibacillus massiliensis]GGJ66143.1 hypothetical protein GCM10007111_30130 [Virgibacillus kapii]CDQ40921.1 hypothetical protein BN990_03269 [Virgibacillus massiliensis]